jgi:type I restriction enzyme S subunit
MPLPAVVFFQEGPGLRKWQWTDSGMKVVNVTNILSDGSVDTQNTARYISLEEFKSKYSHFAVENRDVVVASSGNTYGKVGRISERDLPLMMNTSVIRFHPLNSATLHPDFLYTFFRSSLFRDQVEKFVVGSAQPNFGPAHLKAMFVPVPPMYFQARVAHIIGGYDELIENNTRRIKILEQMAQMLYREWFVNFRFPGHEKVKMVESEVGLIPASFELALMESIAQVLRGRSYKGPELSESGGLPFVNLKCIARDGGFRLDGMKRYTGAYKQTQVAKAGDIIMAVTDMTQERRVVARCGRVPSLPEGFATFSMDVVKIQPNQNVPREYLYSFLRFSTFADSVKEHANGANVLHLSPTLIERFRLPVPPLPLTTKFSALVTPIYELADTLERRNTNLRITRDLLLPKLVSGEVSVKTLEEEVLAETV